MFRKMLMPVCIILVMVGAVTYLCAGHTEPERELIEKGPYFEIYKDGSFNYSYAVFDGYTGGQPVKTEENLTREPRISYTRYRNYIAVMQWYGTGIYTQQTYYYDPDTGRLSEIYDAVLDQYGTLVAYATTDRIVLRDVFDETGFYQEITEFSYPFAQTAEKFTEAHFIGDGQQIVISYYTGDDHEIVSEIFDVERPEDASINEMRQD